jgi:zinc transport system ATP-binding protein
MIRFDRLVLRLPHLKSPPSSFSLSLEEPGFFLVMGPNGSGKTTLAKTLLGLIPPETGKVIWKNKPLIGYVPQLSQINPFFPLPVKRILEMAIPAFWLNKPDWFDFNFDNLTKVWSIESLLPQSFSSLSLGQKTRVLIVRSLLAKPDLLVMDEPLASLDPQGQKLLYETVKNLFEQKKTWMFVIDHHSKNWLFQTSGILNFKFQEEKLFIDYQKTL